MFKTVFPFCLCLLMNTLNMNVYAWEEFQNQSAFDELIKDIQEDFAVDITQDIPHPNRKPHYWFRKYEIYSSDEKQFAYFRVFKVATGTITTFLREQVPDLKASHSSHVPKKCENYFKFAFVRNPWDRIVSFYCHKILTKDTEASKVFKKCFGQDFDFFVDFVSKLDLTTADPHIRLQTLLIPVEQCDFIGKIDNFANDLELICEKIGIKMGKFYYKHKTEHDHYSTYYTPITREIIEKKYQEDIAAFGFTFETQ